MTEFHELDSSNIQYIGNEADKEAVSSMSGVRSRCCGSSEGSIRRRSVSKSCCSRWLTDVVSNDGKCRRQVQGNGQVTPRQCDELGAGFDVPSATTWGLVCGTLNTTRRHVLTVGRIRALRVVILTRFYFPRSFITRFLAMTSLVFIFRHFRCPYRTSHQRGISDQISVLPVVIQPTFKLLSQVVTQQTRCWSIP